MAEQPRYRPLKSLKAAILLLMAGFMLLYGVLLYFEFVNYGYIVQLKNGVQFPQAELESSDNHVLTTATLVQGLFFVTGVVFLCVLYRLRKNAETLGATSLPFSPGWTVGWFFVPVANLFMPYKGVRDLWKASVPVAGRWQDNPASPWWDGGGFCGSSRMSPTT